MGKHKKQTNTNPQTALTAEQTLGLQNMAEEEKLARDVYLTLAQKYDADIFNRIAASENRHMSAVGSMLTKYGIENPTTNQKVGDFKTEEVQNLYDTLTAQSTTYEKALATGVQIEEMDIADLQKQLDTPLPSDIKRVYQNLLKGSQHHLWAFNQH